MNKVFNINLGGYPFTIDDDAYRQLSSYLKTIHNHFKHSEGYEEITSDIETRIAELFQESLGNHSIVSLKLVNETIVIMGTPEEFGAEPLDDFEEDAATFTTNSRSNTRNYKTGKRLLRDSEDQVIGGVCSGIAAYFGINDPLWVRIFFIIFTISGGVGLPAYIILWAIVPEAKTSSDRLAMRGDKINVSNMAKIIEEEVEHISDRISEMSESWDGLGKKKSAAERAEFRRGIKNVFQLFGKGIRFGIELLSTIIRPIIFIVGFALIIAFAAVWLVAIISFFMGFPFLQFILPNHSILAGVWIANLAIFIGVPILSLILLASRLVFKTHYNVRWKIGLLAFYILNAISLFGISSYTLSQFSSEAQSQQLSESFSIEGDVLNINFTENPYENTWLSLGPDGLLKISGDNLVNENINLIIRKSDDENFSLIQDSKSRGKGLAEAKSLAEAIRYRTDLGGNQLNIHPYFLLNKNEKWRNQQVTVTLKVPEGKAIKFTNLYRTDGYKVDYVDDKNHHHHLYWARDGEEYKMKVDGLLGAHKTEVPKQEKEDFDFRDEYKDFSRLHIEGNIKVYVEQGDQFSTKLTGRDHYLKKVEIIQSNEILAVTSPLSRTTAPIRLYITMPSLTELSVENTDDIKLSGFKEDKMLIQSESKSDIKAYIDVENLSVKLDGKNELDIRGKGGRLSASLDNRAKLDAARFSVSYAVLSAKERSNAKLAVSDTLRQNIDRRSSVKVDGEPVILSE